MLIWLINFKVFSQFYNGSQLTFGKNRVQFDDRFWSFLRFNRYDVYYYKEGKPLAIYTARYADKEIAELEKKLEYTLENKIQFVIFNKYSDLKQSNIGLMDEDAYNTGGVTHILGTKVFIYFDGDHKKLELQIKYGIAKIMLNEILYGQSYLSRIKNSTLINFPDWYLEGLLFYISSDWNSDIDNRIKDGILSGRYKKFNRLQGNDAIYAGYSIWKYIETKYGETTIPNLIYMSKINRNVENGFLFVLGVSFKTLIKEWYDYYYNYKYLPVSIETTPVSSDVLLKKIKKDRVYARLRISPAGGYAAYTTNERGQYKIWLYDFNREKGKIIFKREHKLDEKVDYSYPVLAWHPSGKILSFFIESKGKTWLYFYNSDTRNLEKRPVYLFEKVLDFSYNNKGDKFVLSAIQKGHSDIFVYNIASNTFETITKDIYDDYNPSFINNSKDIIFSSNRKSDTLKTLLKEENEDFNIIGDNYDIFIYHFSSKSNILKRISNTNDADEIQPMQYDKQHITYLSNANGILNRYVAKLDSTVSFVDTIVHYRQFVTSFPVTNNLFNIIYQDFNPFIGKYSEIVYNRGASKMYIKEITPAELLKPIDLKNYSVRRLNLQTLIDKPQQKASNIQIPVSKDTGYIYIQSKSRHKGFTDVYANPVITDTVKSSNKNSKIPATDTNKVDINNYTLGKNAKRVKGKDSLQSSNKQAVINNQQLSFIIPRARNANTEYSISQLVTQLDFSFLNYSYQTFSGGSSPIYINPGFAPVFKVGVNDLFEDYRVVGGVRLSTNLVGNEYFISFSNFKKRLDRELILHRNSIENSSNTSVIRTHTDEILYILTYPFSQVLNMKITGTLRDDRYVYMSVDSHNLKLPNLDKIWSGIKVEYSFDNTRNIGLNLNLGKRYKFFAEYFRQLNTAIPHDLFVLGFDYRQYVKISRTFIWTNRIAGSTSFGRDKLIYYMGGVDTWLNPSFNSETTVAQDRNYAFQTIATPMRGFKQNIRNGNSFVVFNSELRFPVFKYFANRPLKSDFFNNFQIIGFTDVGTAWNGPSPYSKENSLFKQVYSLPGNPIVVTIINQKDPLVEGFGFGLRSRLFGYFVRADYSWGVEGREIQKPVFYLSLSLDF